MNEIDKLKKEKYSHIKDWNDEVIELAIDMHNTYEVFSQEEKWQTQKSNHLKPFKKLPMENQRVMLRMADSLINGPMKRTRIEAIDEEIGRLISLSHDLRNMEGQNPYKIYCSEGQNIIEWIDKRIKELEALKQ